MACVGQTGTQAVQPSAHFAASTRSAPPWRSGSAGGRAVGKGHGFAAALQAMGNGIKDEHGSSQGQSRSRTG